MTQIAYTMKQATEALGINNPSDSTVTEAIRRGDLIARKIDGQVVILHEDLVAWANAWPKFDRLKGS